MRSLTARPVLLVLTLLLIVGAILFINSRFGSADAGDQAASIGTSAETTPEETTAASQPEPEPAPETTEQPQTTESQSEPETAGQQSLAKKEAEYPRAEEIQDPTGFVNTDGVSLQQAAGENKVVLLDFWTYSCFNCQNTQPYLNAWHDRYADQGLEIVGVHKPEFEFEKDPAGVEAAVREAGIQYPVVIDNNDATWDAWDQSYWPTMYLIDSDGFVRYKHIGEGAYKETEAEIQKLLAEKNSAQPTNAS